MRALISARPRAEPGPGMTALRLRDEFLVGVGLESLDAAFVAVAAVLDAAERRLGCRDREAVHPDHARLQRLADRGRGLGRAREGVSGEPIRHPVVALDDLLHPL